MRAFLKAIGEVISAILFAIQKAQERKRQAKGRADRERIRADPVGEFNQRYGMRSPEAPTNPPGDDMDRPGG